MGPGSGLLYFQCASKNCHQEFQYEAQIKLHCEFKHSGASKVKLIKVFPSLLYFHSISVLIQIFILTNPTLSDVYSKRLIEQNSRCNIPNDSFIGLFSSTSGRSFNENVKLLEKASWLHQYNEKIKRRNDINKPDIKQIKILSRHLIKCKKCSAMIPNYRSTKEDHCSAHLHAQFRIEKIYKCTLCCHSATEGNY